MRYLVRGEAYVDGPDRPEDAWEQILHPDTLGAIAFKVVDIQQLPREAQPVTRDEVRFPSTRHQSGFEEDPLKEESPLLSDMNVVHPWDQGLFIFPEGHPLAEYERLARDKPITSEVEAEGYRRQKAAFLEVSNQLALPKGGEST